MPVPAPVVSQSVDVAPVSGTVLIKLPGGKGFIVLRAGEQVPVGSTVDVRHGQIRLTSALDAHGHTESDVFNGAEFVIAQAAGAHPVTALQFQDTGPVCGTSAGAARAGKKKPKLKTKKHASPVLWGSGNGSFRTVGANGYGTERGTIWATQDRCTGTFFHVRGGSGAGHRPHPPPHRPAEGRRVLPGTGAQVTGASPDQSARLGAPRALRPAARPGARAAYPGQRD